MAGIWDVGFDLNPAQERTIRPPIPHANLKPPSTNRTPRDLIDATATAPVICRYPSSPKPSMQANLTGTGRRDHRTNVRTIASAATILVALASAVAALYFGSGMISEQQDSVDYAFANTGGRVIPLLTSATFKSAGGSSRSPITALSSDMSPGSCWAMSGSEGQIGIQLSHTIELSGIAIDHPPTTILLDPTTAPRQFTVWAVLDPSSPNVVDQTTTTYSNAPVIKGYQVARLGSFEYSINSKRSFQKFVLDQDVRKWRLSSPAVIVKVESNWGNKEFTCIYSIKAYGKCRK